MSGTSPRAGRARPVAPWPGPSVGRTPGGTACRGAQSLALALPGHAALPSPSWCKHLPAPTPWVP